MNKDFEYFEEFTQRMDERIKMGRKQYGNDWFFKDLCKDMEEELLDLANYAYLLFRKVKEFKKILK